jgi:hypothetical protein
MKRLTIVSSALLAISLSFTHVVYAKDSLQQPIHSYHKSKHHQKNTVVKVVQVNKKHNQQVIIKKVIHKPVTNTLKSNHNNQTSITVLVAEHKQVVGKARH